MQIFSKLFGVSNKTFQFLFQNKKQFLGKLVVVLPLAFWSSFLYQITPLFYKLSIDSITENQQTISVPFTSLQFNFSSPVNLLFVVLGFLLALNLLDAVLKFISDSLIQKINYQITAGFEDNFIQFLSRFDSSFIGAENNMRLVEDIQWQIRSIEDKITSLITSLVTIPTSIITIAFILPLIHPYLGLFVILISLSNLLFEHISWRSWQKFELVRGRIGSIGHRIRNLIIYNFSTVVGSGWTAKLWSLYRQKRGEEFEVNFTQDQTNRKIRLAGDFVSEFLNLGSKVMAGFLVISGQITIGSFVIFDQYVSRFSKIFDDIAALGKSFMEIRFELFKIDFVLNLQSKIDFSAIQKFQQKEIQSIEFKNVNFTYPQFYEEEKAYFKRMQKFLKLAAGDESKSQKKSFFSFLNFGRFSVWRQSYYKKLVKELEETMEKTGSGKQVLGGINLKLEKGKIYALVGYNGAGKTTLTSLLKRSMDTTSGEILVDNRNLKTIDPDVWKENISAMEQNSLIWRGISIKDNLLLGTNKQVSDERILEVLKMVGLEKAVTDITEIYGEGVELSGGQEQLLELARIIIQEKQLVILDEGTNQLDVIKEANILKILNQIKKDRIVVFISHRMTSASKCDQIVVLDSGKIEAIGSHKQLINSPTENLYKTMWEIQVQQN